MPLSDKDRERLAALRLQMAEAMDAKTEADARVAGVRAMMDRFQARCDHPDMWVWHPMGRDTSRECPDCGYAD